MTNLAQRIASLFDQLGLPLPRDGALEVRSPITQETIARLPTAAPEAADRAVQAAQDRFTSWREVPAPQRGVLVRSFGELVRQHKAALGEIISIEVGKIRTEGLGEVQEVVDICEFAVGLSRQLHGLVIASERPGHKLLESWHPLGPTLVISAFNFPMAVWAWNASLALVCGNTLLWKPSEKTPLSALAMQGLLARAAQQAGVDPAGLSQVLLGDAAFGEQLVRHPGVKCVSATGSTRMGRAVALACAEQFKRSILELGGNNAAIICESADLSVALPAVVFAAAGTAGQRCTTTRRLFVHSSKYDTVVDQIKAAYQKLAIGNPLDDHTRVGPLFEERSFHAMLSALEAARAAGGRVTGGERVMVAGAPNAFYVRPAIVEMPAQCGPMLEETFAPILYVRPFDTVDEAIALNNAAAHGLSSAIFTNDLRESERFLGASGSDCGIANVNAGTSGAEIGGAFGGEKETGGGRESGSDAWKGYMRRATNTINHSRSVALAQGVQFTV
ncbi:MAG: aldehyde dehydrogenase family protein [Pseudomonadota bacterium]